MRLVSIAISNVLRRRARFVFLALTLVLGVATVVALLTVSDALTVQAQDRLETFGANIVVTPRSDELALAYGDVALGGVAVGAREIDEADLQAIGTIPNHKNIAIVAPKLLGAVKVQAPGAKVPRGQVAQAVLMGVRPREEFAMKKWWTLDGRPPSGGDELVAGAAAARRFSLAPGDRVQLSGRAFTVSGVLRPSGSQDDELLIVDLAAAQRLLRRPGEVTMVEVAALCSNCPIADIVDQLTAVLPGTKVTAMQQVVKNNMSAMERLRTFSYILAAVVVAIEALVVFVTMMGSVNARTREIGVLRALGFRRRHVTHLILLEAGLASLVAGVLGYLAGMLVSYGVAPLLADGGSLDLAWVPAVAGGALVLALAVCALAALYPALRASRLDPTVALRAL